MRIRLDEFEQNIKHAIPPCNNKEEGMLNNKIEITKYKKKKKKLKRDLNEEELLIMTLKSQANAANKKL